MTELVERFARIVRDSPGRVLIHAPSSGDTLSAAELQHRAAVIAAALERAALPPGSLVALATGNHPSTFAAWLACSRLGLALLPLDRGATDVEARELTEAFGPVAMLAAAPLAGALDIGPGAYLKLVEPRVARPAAYAGAAVLKLTSGTTGQPKATWTTEAQLLADAAHIIDGMGIRPDDVQLGVIPLSHSYGIGNLVLPLLLQGTSVTLRESFIPHQLPFDAATWGARVFCGVPYMFEHLLQHPPASGWPPSLTHLISAGARLEPTVRRDFHRMFGVFIHSFYGTSETGGIAFDAEGGEASGDRPGDAVVGRPLPGVSVELRTIDAQGPSEGRVHVRSAAVSTGYVGPGAERESFVDGGFLTGDVARLDEAGRLVLIGRMSNFVNVAGRKVQPEEVERVLRSMPQIADAHVCGVADATRGELLVACVVARGAPPTIFDVRQHCSRYLSPHKLPRWLLTLETFPRTERGKLDRRRLQQLVTESVGRSRQADMT